MATAIRLSVCLNLIVIGCVMAAATSSVFAAKNGTDRPFKGVAVGVAEFSSPTEAIIEYTGRATHLGRFTRIEYLTINDDGFTFQGNMIFTAANGDELWLDFSGMFVSQTDAVGFYDFTGGTGRFESASGTAEFEAFTPDFVNVTATFEGMIDY